MSTYNDSAHLAESIESVLCQDSPDFEFIIVDDGSSDSRTAEILTRYSTLDPRIRVITKPNQGLTRALVDGCAAARGEYIARIDVGDTMAPHRLRHQSEVLDRHTGVAFVSGWTEFCGPKWEHLWTEKSPLSEDSSRPGEEMAALGAPGPAPGAEAASFDPQSPNPMARVPHAVLADVWSGNVLPDVSGRSLRTGPTHHGSVMMRAAAYHRAGGYRWQFYYGQDWDLWYRLAEQGMFAVVPEVLYRARLFAGSLSALNNARQEAIGRCALDAFTLRRQGGDEAVALEQAARIRPNAGTRRRATAPARAAGWYFVGAALLRNRDPRCRAYLWKAVRFCPYHLRAWLKLALSLRLR
jgi:glycosyltransferase involved in cell wall biosynthesis